MSVAVSIGMKEVKECLFSICCVCLGVCESELESFLLLHLKPVVLPLGVNGKPNERRCVLEMFDDLKGYDLKGSVLLCQLFQCSSTFSSDLIMLPCFQ